MCVACCFWLADSFAEEQLLTLNHFLRGILSLSNLHLLLRLARRAISTGTAAASRRRTRSTSTGTCMSALWAMPAAAALTRIAA